MDWIKVSVLTNSQGIEPVIGRLSQLGIYQVEIEDEQDFLNFLEENKKMWDYVDEELIESKKGKTKVNLYLADNMQGHEQLKLLKKDFEDFKKIAGAEFGPLEIELETVREEDWENSWKKYFKPIKIGNRIYIKPEWEELKDSEGRIVFTINPGMSFGTGSHESTQLCILQTEKYLKEGSTVLDIGCGSGILSIIALLLGAKSAIALDIDKNAADIAMKNAKINNVDDKYATYTGDILNDKDLYEKIRGQYDFVFANIVADVIIPLAPIAKTLVKPGGYFLTSGIIDFRKDECIDAITKEGFRVVEILKENDWVSMLFTL